MSKYDKKRDAWLAAYFAFQSRIEGTLSVHFVNVNKYMLLGSPKRTFLKASFAFWSCYCCEKRWGPFRGATTVTSLNFKTLRFTYWGGRHVPVAILPLFLRLSSSLLHFQSIFLLFVAISSVLCHCFKSKVTLTGLNGEEVGASSIDRNKYCKETIQQLTLEC